MVETPPPRQFKSSENSPCINQNKLLNQHHRSKALVHNIMFNSLSQNSSKYYTITLDEGKFREALPSQAIETSLKSKDQKRLVIEEIENFSDDKNEFMNFKFGKKYFTSKLKNPLFNDEASSRTENSLTLNSLSEKRKSQDNKMFQQLSERDKSTLTGKNSEEKNSLLEISTKNSSEKTEKNERKFPNNKLLKYLQKLKKSNVVVDVDELNNKISRVRTLNPVSKSMNLQKVISHKFNSNSIVECSSEFKPSNFDNKFLVMMTEHQQMKQKVAFLENKIKIQSITHAKEKFELERRYNVIEKRLENTEKALSKLLDKLILG